MLEIPKTHNKAVKNAGVPHLLGRRKARGAVYLNRYV